MEAALEKSDQKLRLPLAADVAQRIASALQELQVTLRAALPQLLDGSGIHGASTPASPEVSVSWLLNLCLTIQSELEPLQLARAIVDAASQSGEGQQQAALFDALGASDEAMEVLTKVAPVLSEIRQTIRFQDLETAASHRESATTSQHHHLLQQNAVVVDVEEERRRFLTREAFDAAQVAAIAQAEVDESMRSNVVGLAVATHTIARSSQQQAVKFAEKAAKRAAQAMQRAKAAGAILNESDLLSIDRTNLGDGGLVNRSNEELWALQQSLLPEGSREYYDKRGMPKDAVRENIGDMERVIIPAAKRDEASLPARLKILDMMDAQLGKAFEGTLSLNPMQSATFDVAFHSRDNMLICAPVSSSCVSRASLPAP